MKFSSPGMLTAEREPTENMIISLADPFPHYPPRAAQHGVVEKLCSDAALGLCGSLSRVEDCVLHKVVADVFAQAVLGVE
jgi:hypothetical protein